MVEAVVLLPLGQAVGGCVGGEWSPPQEQGVEGRAQPGEVPEVGEQRVGDLLAPEGFEVAAELGDQGTVVLDQLHAPVESTGE
jgi:hypothetical protein